MNTNSQKFDLIVVGAGVAGGIFAASQPADRKILVIERNLSEPDRIIGELMQPGGIQSLKKMGLEFLLEGIDGQDVYGYNLIKGNERFIIEYDDVQYGIKGMGMRNGKFLTNIRNELRKRENITLIQGNVTEILEENDNVIGVAYTQEDGAKITQFANLTVVCDGPMSLLRDKLSKVNKKVSSYFIGMILKDLKLKHPSHGHMIITGNAPILIYPTHTNAYRILIDCPGSKPPRIGKKSVESLKQNILSVLPPEMEESFANAIEEGDIKAMPNHTMIGQAFQKNGAVLLGDSLNMRHPLTGGGMTATFSDIICLNEQLVGVDFTDMKTSQLAINAYYEKRKEGVETINILANALYEVLMDKELKDAIFEYLKEGGQQSDGPLSILSGLNKDKQTLIKHFYKMPLQHPLNILINPTKHIRMYKNATKIIRPILKDQSVSTMI